MNTKHTFKSKKESVSLNFQDSNLKVNRSNDNQASAHTIATSNKPNPTTKRTYKWIKRDGHIIGIKCLVCGIESFGEDDIKHKYCGRCHIFHKENISQPHHSISNGEIKREKNTPIESTDPCCQLPKSKDTTPHLKVSVDFAASQWFQILLVHLNSKNKSLNGVLEPIGECHLGLNG